MVDYLIPEVEQINIPAGKLEGANL